MQHLACMSGGGSFTSGSSAFCSGSAILQGTAALLLSPMQQVSAGHIWHGNLRFGAVSTVPYARRLWKSCCRLWDVTNYWQ
eukprot:1837433-Pleurochrysis_carterae.AAC.1